MNFSNAEWITKENQQEGVQVIQCHPSWPAHLVVPDDCDVCRRAAVAPVVGDVVVFGAWDPAGGEEERVEVHAQRLPSHVLNRQLPADRDRRNKMYC